MSQTLRPISTISTDGGWTVTGAVLPNDAVDDVIADDDATIISTGSTGTLVLGLDAPANTPSSNAISVTCRTRAQILVGDQTIDVSLYSGSTLLGTDQIVCNDDQSFTNQSVTFTPMTVADWSDLRLKLVGTNSDFGQFVLVTQVYATVADGATASGARTGRAARMLVNTCTIRRKTESQASTGESVSAFADIYSAVPCSVQQDTSSEALAYFRETGKRTGRAYFSPGTDVLNTDRLTTVAGGGASGFTGATLAVTGPPVDHAGRGAYLMVPWEEVKGGLTT